MKGPMKLIDPNSGLMECLICGAKHYASLLPGGKRYARGSRQCPNGCKPKSQTGQPTDKRLGSI
jgi:hypothetical protein